MKLRFLCFILFSLVFCNQIQAKTFYVGQFDSGTGNGDLYSNRMSVEKHNSYSFKAGDIIYLCDEINTTLVPPNSGEIDNPIVYRGDYIGHTLALNVQTTNGKKAINLAKKSNIIFTNSNDRPVINSQIDSGDINSSGNSNESVLLDNASNITFNYWEIKNGWTALRGENVNGVRITKCYINHMRQDGVHFTYSKNILIGGSKDDANEFYRCTYKTAWVTNAIGADIRLWISSNIVVSHNELHGTKGAFKDGWGMIGIGIYRTQYVVCEYNSIHDHGAKNKRPPIHAKSEWSKSFPGKYVVIRYNNIYDEPTVPDWSYNGNTAIALTRNNSYYWIYGNRIDNCGSGIIAEVNGEYNHRDGMDGLHTQSIYIWANVISNLSSYGINLSSASSTNTDYMFDIHVINNTMFNISNNAIKASSRFGYGEKPYVTFKNNIITNSGLKYSPHCSFNTNQTDSSDLSIGNNIFYDSDYTKTIKVLVGNKSSSPCYPNPCDYDSENLPNGWFENTFVQNPTFTNSKSGDLSLDRFSVAVDSGIRIAEKMENFVMPFYQKDQMEFSFNEILHPDTNWAVHPPSIVIGYQDKQGNGSEIGAYVYKDSSTTTLNTSVLKKPLNIRIVN